VDDEGRGPAVPHRLRPNDLEPSLEHRPMEDEGLELPALAARAQPDPLMEGQEPLDGVAVEPPPEPLRPEALRGDPRDDRLDPRLEVLPEEPRLVPPPQWREHAQPEVVAHRVHAAVLVVARDRANDDAVDLDGGESPSQGLKLRLLALPRPLPHERDPHRLRLKGHDMEVRHVVEHRVGVLREDRHEVGHLPSLLHRRVRGVCRVLAAGEEGRDPHGQGHRPRRERASAPPAARFRPRLTVPETS